MIIPNIWEKKKVPNRQPEYNVNALKGFSQAQIHMKLWREQWIYGGDSH